ncbi:hypothetical protein KAZ82_00430 [Candidatus Babeliales bacterium]|nr:hypothetical protein [Candidatus Babeliales bacterium]
MKYKYFSVFLCMASIMYTSNDLKNQTKLAKALDKFGQSKFIHAYSVYVQSFIDKFQSYGFNRASDNYQELGLEAQNALGVFGKYRLPVKKMISNTIIKAVVGSDGIYVNEKVLDAMSFGSRRCTMFHESVHAKYHDAAVLGMLKILGFCAGSVGMYKLLGVCKIVMLRKSFSVLIGIVSSVGLSFRYRQFMERRADIQGHYATDCASCVQEEIDQRTKMFESTQKAIFDNLSQEKKEEYLVAVKKQYENRDFTDDLETFECFQGYLRRSELKQIAQDLGVQRCKYHSEQY